MVVFDDIYEYDFDNFDGFDNFHDLDYFDDFNILF